jgi:hypothetical protein
MMVVVGRAPDCDVRLDEPTVSARHLRMRWDGAVIVLEDLGSANGTWISGQRVTSACVRVGEEVILGGVSLPWSDPQLTPFLRGGRSDTVHTTLIGRLYLCGRCGKRGFLPRAIKRAEIQCGSCGAVLEMGAPTDQRVGTKRKAVLGVMLALALLSPLLFVGRDRFVGGVRSIGKHAEIAIAPVAEAWEPVAGSAEETAIRASVRDRVVAAIDHASPITRNLAAQVAARDPGTFHVGQVAAIWREVRSRWSYVNDPRGDEYFATATETIENNMVGDCDDFAILLVSMIEAIGGDARIVMSDGDRGGHAYAEACVPGEPESLITELRAHYRRQRARVRVNDLHYRSDDQCAVWLNLDWNAETPGGPFGSEVWAVAIYPDSKTETLAPAQP